MKGKVIHEGAEILMAYHTQDTGADGRSDKGSANVEEQLPRN